MLGNNGSGKTTLMHALAGLRRPLAGAVSLDGTPLSTLGPAARARRIGLLLQEERSNSGARVLDYVCLGRYPHRRSLFGWEPDDERMAREQLDRMDLGTLGRQRSLSTLSGGERQRARLALLLTQDPAFYLLDEPLQHLDLRHQLLAAQCFVDLARQRSRGVVMVLHDPRLARSFCDHALLLYGPDARSAGPAATRFDRRQSRAALRSARSPIMPYSAGASRCETTAPNRTDPTRPSAIVCSAKPSGKAKNIDRSDTCERETRSRAGRP